MSISALEVLRKKSRGISLGLFAADVGELRNAAHIATDWGCRIVHFDIMDGVFVPSMTAGASFVSAIDTGQLRDVHLMIENPSKHVASYIAAGADMITVHAEAPDAAQALCAVRKVAADVGRPVLAGLGIMPNTTLDAVDALLDLVPDMVLILSVDPRTKSPPDITAACERLNQLRQRCSASNPVLAFDGGATLDSIGEIAACRPDMIVSGSAVFKAENPKHAFVKMSAVL